jgi:hypothetical protein
MAPSAERIPAAAEADIPPEEPLVVDIAERLAELGPAKLAVRQQAVVAGTPQAAVPRTVPDTRVEPGIAEVPVVAVAVA